MVDSLTGKRRRAEVKSQKSKVKSQKISGFSMAGNGWFI
jgi:hypothetical protein